MSKRNLIVSLTGVAVLVAGTVPALQASPQGVGRGRSLETPGPAAAAEESYYPQDPADSLYRAAREQLNRDNYRRAAEMFAQVYARYPRSDYAAQALYYQAFALYRNGRDEDLERALGALERLQERYSDSEVALEDAESLQARISGELGRRGYAEEAEETYRRAHREGCTGEDEIRIAALNALLQMSSEQALPILERVLANRDDDECSVELRRKAVFLLSQHVDERTVDILLDLVRNDPDAEIRSQAVFWLSQVHGERTVEALEEILLESESPELQEKAIFALSQHHSSRSGQILRDYAMREDAPLELREKAIFWLGQQHGAENAQFLRELYGSTESSELRKKIIFSLAQMHDRESGRWLLERAADTDESYEVRKSAIFWAGQAGVAIADMAEIYDRLPDREMKEQVIFALSQRHEDEAVDKLLDIARNETDTELKKKAIFWLSQSHDPRVAEFLLELIEGGQ
jgi:HEAT repeat protein